MKKIFILFFAFSISFNVFSQSAEPKVFGTGGNFYKNANYSLSWTIGETVIKTVTSTNNILTQGFQQPCYSLSAIKENVNSAIEILAYPNPASEFINLEIKSQNKNYNIELEIIDIAGKTVITQKLKNKISKVNLSRLAKGTYLLKLFAEDIGEIKVYKIQKIK